MKTILGLFLCLVTSTLIGCAAQQPTAVKPTIIATGACAHENRPQPIWDAVVAANPDFFIFTGDNIYGPPKTMTGASK